MENNVKSQAFRPKRFTMTSLILLPDITRWIDLLVSTLKFLSDSQFVSLRGIYDKCGKDFFTVSEERGCSMIMEGNCVGDTKFYLRVWGWA